MRDVFVAGVGMIRFGRYKDRDVPDLGAEAALMALKDAGLSIREVEYMAAGCLFQANAMVGQRVMQEIGQTGIPVVNVANACATGSTAFREAWMAVASGMHDVAICVGVEQMGKMGLLGNPGGGSGVRTEGVIGSGLMPAVFGQAGMEHMRKYGTTVEQFAKVAVKNHRHSTRNPLSQYQVEVSLDDVLAARMVAYPNTLYMCCPTGDGAAAAVVVSPEKARQLGTKVKVLASVLTSDPWSERDLTLPDVNTLTRNAARIAWEQAGVGPDDLDLVELHDCFATAELLHYENLGLCGEGEAGRMIDQGETAVGGRIPVNVSGGLLSKGHPLGATGVAGIYEVTTHLRGAAGARQVEGAKVGLSHVIGLGSACTINVLGNVGS
jgi:acetyl-CoA acyltransferase